MIFCEFSKKVLATLLSGVLIFSLTPSLAPKAYAEEPLDLSTAMSAIEEAVTNLFSQSDESPTLTTQAVGRQAMYRLYNRWSGEHFFSSDESEYRYLISIGWNDEAIGWYAPLEGTPVYRLYNRWTGDHHFTTDASERDACVKAGWNNEGVGFYSPSDGIPIYRLYNKYVKAFYHHYTSAYDEYQACITAGWMDEGIGWRGYDTATGPADPTPSPEPEPEPTIQLAKPTVDLKSASDTTLAVQFNPDPERDVEYTAQVAEDPSFANVLYDQARCGSLITAENLTPSKTYYVRAQSTLDNSRSAWSDTTTVTTKGAAKASNEFEVKFNSNYSGGPAATSQYVVSGAEESLKANRVRRIDYDFLGWSTTPTGNVEYFNKEFIKEDKAPGTVMNLYAVWEQNINSYTVKFDKNGGSGAMADLKIEYGTSTPLSPNKIIDPINNTTTSSYFKNGYTFEGWSKSASSLVAEYGDQESVLNLAEAGGTVTLYAVWKPLPTTYTIKYDPNGIGFPVRLDGTENKLIPNQTAAIGQSVTLSSQQYTSDGCTFKGWSTSAQGDGTRYNPGSTVSSLGAPGQTVTLYAQWELGGTTVIYNPNGVGSQTLYQEIPYGESRYLYGSMSSDRYGYEFESWNTKSDGTGTRYAASFTNAPSLQGSAEPTTLNLYAQWTVTGYTINFDGNGGTLINGKADSQIADVRFFIGLRPCMYTRSGFVFTGWNKKQDGTGLDVGDGNIVSNLAEGGGSVTLYAQWKAASSVSSYTVRFNANGGSGAMSDQTIASNTGAALSSNLFTRQDCRFKGWTTNPDGSGTLYVDEANVNNLGAAGSTVNLYAQWEAAAGVNNTYTVRFNANGGSGTMAAQTLTRNLATALTSNGFSREYCNFEYWTTNADGSGVRYNNGASALNLANPGETIELFAQWKVITGELTLSNGDIIYIKGDGTRLTGWRNPAANQYKYYDPNNDGIMVKNRTINITTTDSTMGEVGKVAGRRRFDASGNLVFGWSFDTEDDGSYRAGNVKYFDVRTGVVKTGEFYMDMFNRTKKDGNPGYRYADYLGNLEYGWQTIGGNRKYFDANGARLTGEQYIYYSQPKRQDREPVPGWVYFNSDGVQVYGWAFPYHGSNQYAKYYDANGKRVVGEQYIEYQIPKPGATVKDGNPGWRYFKGTNNANDPTGGIMAKGWEGVGGVTKYYTSIGVRLVGKNHISRDYLSDTQNDAGVADPAPGYAYFKGTNAKNDMAGGALLVNGSYGGDYYGANGKLGPKPQPLITDTNQLARQIFNYYNDYRRRMGLQPTIWSDVYAAEAMNCNWINASKEGLYHTVLGRRRADPPKRYLSDILQFTTWCIQPKEAVDAWIKSEGHRKMMQCKQAMRAGVAVLNFNGIYYQTIVYDWDTRNADGA